MQLRSSMLLISLLDLDSTFLYINIIVCISYYLTQILLGKTYVKIKSVSTIWSWAKCIPELL